MNENELSTTAKVIRNQYAREWRAKNPDKVQAANARYWLKKAKEAENHHGKADDKR
jgi:hypothetical protein